MKNNIVYLAIGNKEDNFQFGIELDYLIKICKTFSDIKFNSINELKKLFKNNFELSQRVFNIAEKENKIILV